MHSSEWLRSKIQVIGHVGQDVEERKHSSQLVEVQINLAFSQETEDSLPQDPAIALLGMYQKMLQHPTKSLAQLCS